MTLVLRASAERAGRELERLHAAMRSPLPISRRVAVIGVAGGRGCSTVAGRLAAAIAARRSDRALVVDASAGRPGALWHAGLLEQPLGDAPKSTTHGRLDALTVPGAPASTFDWWAVARERQRAAAMSVTDWGTADASRLAAIAALSHVVVVVARADRADAQRALDVAAAVEAGREARAAIALVDVQGTAAPAMRELAELLPVPGTVLRHARALREARHVALSMLPARSRLDLLRLAGSVVSLAAVSSGRAAITVAPPIDRVPAASPVEGVRR